MALFLQMVGTVGILLAGVGLAYGSLEFYRLRHLLQTGALRVLVEADYGCGCRPHSTITASLGGFAVYIFKDKKWTLHSDMSLAGYESVPPQIPGAYEGHVVRTFSVLKAHGREGGL